MAKKRDDIKFFPKNKRGQFFLIAAVVIIVVIVSVVTISNYTQKKEVSKLYDLGQELGIESQNVLDYGTYNSNSPEDIVILMEQFINNYHNYQEQDKNVYFVFGNKEKVNVLGYQDIRAESICIKLNPEEDEEGEETECRDYVTLGATQAFPATLIEENKITKVAIVIGVDSAEYQFRLKEGENFYFVIWQQIGGERHVIQNE